MVAVLATSFAACRREDQPSASAPASRPSAAPAGASTSPPGSAAAVAAAAAAGSSAPRRVVVEVTEAGFVPEKIAAEAGKPIVLAVTRKTDRTCARELTIKGQPGKTELPLNREVDVTYTPTAAGTVPFGCAMGMMVSGAFDVH